MTTDREEKLIEDVAWMRGKLESYFESVAPTLATKESVDAVDRKIDTHLDGHVGTRGLVAAWCGTIAAIAIAIYSAFPKHGGN